MQFRDMSADAFVRLARRQVAHAFEANRNLPDQVAQVPLIGGTYDPHAPPEQLAELQQDAVRALCCARWAETECPPWVLPLPLKPEDCYALFNGPHQNNRRSRLRGEYGMHARTMGWVVERMTPFELFCAYGLLPPASPI